jgi:hypothetical protein
LYNDNNNNNKITPKIALGLMYVKLTKHYYNLQIVVNELILLQRPENN